MVTGQANVAQLSQEERDILSFLRQNVARKLALEAHTQGLPQTHPRVLRAVIAHFNLGPTLHQGFNRLVWAVALGR